MAGDGHTLPAELRRHFTADPARWLLKARPPLVKFRAAVDLLGWPREHGDVVGWWRRRYEDADLAAVRAAQLEDGLWYAPEPFFRRRPSLYAPRFRAAAWQFPLLAGFGLALDDGVAARAAAAVMARRTDDGFFDLGPAGPFVLGNALVVSSLAALGMGVAELAAARRWLASRQRGDGGWADAFELADAAVPSTFGTTAEVVRALAGGGEDVRPAVCRGKEYLLANLFSDYNGRFLRSAARWRRLSWPQYRFDALSVATALRTAGATPEELTPLAAAVADLQLRRGFWRQQVPFGERCWLEPVRAGRASRWVTFNAAAFLGWFYDREGRGK